VSDRETRQANPCLPAMPLAGLENLLALMDEVRADLPAITAPALVVHGRKDHTVPMDDSLELTGSLGSPVVERLWLERSFHLVGIDVERHQLIEAATRFLGRHARW
jgi:carboxylesterase